MDKIGSLEENWRKQGFQIIGFDEVGCGCLAGPVWAGAVMLDYDKLMELPTKERALIRDSKSLSAAQRQRILPTIKNIAIAFATGSSSPREIETMGITDATWEAMQRALAKLTKETNLAPTSKLLAAIDGPKRMPRLSLHQEAVVKGDARCYCIAAASILAKVERDHFMTEQDKSYPQYGFAAHVGYGTKRHLTALKDHGICPLHRRNFAPMRSMVKNPTSLTQPS